MAWEFAKMLGTPTSAPAVQRYLVGTGGVTKGMPVTFGAANDVVAAAGGAVADDILGVAMGTVIAGGYVEVMLATDDTVFWIQRDGSDTVISGTRYNLTATTLTIDATLTANPKVKTLYPDPNRSGWFACVNISFLA